MQRSMFQHPGRKLALWLDVWHDQLGKIVGHQLKAIGSAILVKLTASLVLDAMQQGSKLPTAAVHCVPI